MDSSTLERTTDKREQLQRNKVGRVTIQTRGPVVIDNHDRVPNLGRIVIVDDDQICGGVYSAASRSRAKTSSGRREKSRRGIAQRTGHRGAVVWFIGLSGAGKSNIAQALERELFNRGMHTYVLDGDNIRHGLNSNLGFRRKIESKTFGG